MEIFWYQLTQVHLEKWPLKWREREPNSHYISQYGTNVSTVSSTLDLLFPFEFRNDVAFSLESVRLKIL